MPPDAARAALTVREVAARYGVRVPTVLAWVRTGQLRAIDVSRRPGPKRPTWRVTQAALDAFEALRTPTPTPAGGRTSRARRKRAGGFVRFY
jgi:excisionase family DNA binding protein